MPSYRSASFEEKSGDSGVRASREEKEGSRDSSAYFSPSSSSGESSFGSTPPPPPDGSDDGSDFSDRSTDYSVDDDSSRSVPACPLAPACTLRRDASPSLSSIDAATADESSGKVRYAGECSYEDLVLREEGKSDTSSETRLDTLRFDYSDVSSVQSRPAPSNRERSIADGSSRVDDSNVVSSTSSLDQCGVSPSSASREPTSFQEAGEDLITNDALRRCLGVLRTFALRCAFDHWTCASLADAAAASSLESVSPISTVSSLSAFILHHNAVATIERLALRMAMRGALSKLAANVEIVKGFSRAFGRLTSVVERATMRRGLIGWVNTNQLIAWRSAEVEARVSMQRCKLLTRALHAWRDITNAQNALRQKYFVAMIFNRWQLYAEEQAMLRRMAYDALLHWAHSKCKRAFRALRAHAKSSKEQRQKKALVQSKRLGYSCFASDTPFRLSTVTPSTNGSQITTREQEAFGSFQTSYRSPDPTRVWSRTPQNLAQPSYGNASERSVGALPQFGRSPLSSLTCNPRFNASAELNRQSCLSPPGSVGSRAPSFARRPLHSELSSGQSTTSLLPGPSYNSAQHYSNESARSTAAPASLEQPMHASASSRKQAPLTGSQSPMRASASPSTQYPQQVYASSGVLPPQPSVRSARQFYQERFVISVVLDDLVSAVERRAGQRSSWLR